MFTRKRTANWASAAAYVSTMYQMRAKAPFMPAVYSACIYLDVCWCIQVRSKDILDTTSRRLLPQRHWAVPALAGAMGALFPKIDKVLGMTQTNDDFAVGDSITFADIAIFALRQFTSDPLFNKYGDIKSTMPPKAAKIAENVAKHPIVAEYLKTDGHLPYTGLMIFY